MNRYLPLLSLLITFSSSAFAQEKCATMPVLEQHRQTNPGLSETMRNQEAAVAEWISNNKTAKRAVATIPVVFHVVYEDAAENIHDSLLISQLNVLNEDYRRLNLDKVGTRAIFDSIASDVEIAFCLAQRDPYGNPTTGITRTQTTKTSFNPITQFDQVKSDSTGGKDPWNTSEYLNIWVCDMSFFGTVFVLGYAQFPGDNPATDGVVLQYQHVGRTYSASAAPANLGRTATHEVGHWLGLRHIWGDGPCDSTDYVADTPNADDASQSDCDTLKNTCSLEDSYWGMMDPPDMVENYMDYSEDACMNAFTAGQKMRMLGFLNTARASLLTSKGCLPPVASLDEINKGQITFSVFPNPSSGKLTVDYNNVAEIIVHDVSGRRVQHILPATLTGTQNIELPSGFFVVTARGEDGSLKTEKVIVK